MKNRTARTTHVAPLAGIVVFLLAIPCFAQTGREPSQLFDKLEVMVPMRDGVRLNTEVYIPKTRAEPLPFLFTRTPYGLRQDDKGFHRALSSAYKELVAEGYIFVFQDIRGRFKSEGQFVMLRPPRDPKDPKAVDESTDTYDTIEWLLKNVPGNNGRVGVLGISYGGWLTVMAMLDPHPAVKAVSPQASPADMFIGDDFLHNGAFRLDFGFGYVAVMEASKEVKPFQFDRYDTFEWYLALGALSNANKKHLHGQMPTWNDFMAHPTYDDYWQRIQVPRYLTRVAVPTLTVAGWWDAEDFYGPLRIYETLEKYDTGNVNHLVVGPWPHGGWAIGDGSQLGPIKFDSPTSQHFREKIQAVWFAHFLKDKGRLEFPEALAFQTGANRWQAHAEWPPRNATVRNLYLHPNGRLAFEPPGESEQWDHDSYVSDPRRPVPYRQRPIRPFWEGDAWGTWKVQDQRIAHRRPDVLSWETEVLAEDFCVTGRIVADLFASTTGSDSDWVVKLIDVYPEAYAPDPVLGGYQLMIADEVLRAKFRNSFERPEPVPPGEVIEYKIDLNSRSHCFLKGHKIMVQVQSSWFPLIDRNPQKFVNVPEATEADYQEATQRIYRSRQFPSHVKLPVASQ